MYNENVMKKQHIFNHLGKAPYRLVDTHESQTVCDYCGTYIVNVFVCEGNDRKRFNLGSSCVEKLEDKELVKQVKTELTERKRQKRHEKLYEARQNAFAQQVIEDAIRVKKMRQSVSKAIPKLKKLSHPNEYFASQGKTYYDYVQYFGQIDVEADQLPDEFYTYNSAVISKIRNAGFEI